MDLRDYLIGSVEDVHRMLGIASQELTDDVAHWQPPGTVNTIAQLLAHVVTGEDQGSHRIRGEDLLFDSGNWASKTGIPADRNIWGKGWRLNIEGFNEYRVLVAEQALAFAKTITPADLDGEFLPRPDGDPRPKTFAVRTLMMHHALGHCGEISTIKGLQGLKGLPF